MRSCLFQSAAALAIFLAAGQAASIQSRATTCNGYADFCEKSYGTLSYVGTHDSYAIGPGGGFNNQDQDITTQLNDGVRMLQSQAHNNSGVLTLCHTSCSFQNGGTLEDYLTKVKSWMNDNPNDVVTLLIVNIDNQPPSAFDAVFKSAGVDTISYTPQAASIAASDWPTLGSMIDSGKRLVTFLDNQADFTVVPYLLDEFSNMWETAFDLTDQNAFDCNVNRSKGDTSTQMYLINHFLDQLLLGQPTPNVGALNVTNSASGTGSLQAQVDTCTSQYTKPPTFMLLDYYEYAGTAPFEIAAKLNGVTYNSSTPIATPVSTSSSASSTTGSSNGALSLVGQQCISVLAFVTFGVMLGGRMVL